MKPPGYRPALNPLESCKTCAYFRDAGSYCEMFSVMVEAAKTCNKWTATRSEVPMSEPTFYWEEWEGRREYSDALRKKYAKEGIALPDGSFPIPDVSALKDAISAYGRAGDKGAAKAFIKKRARALGRTDLIPESWRADARLVELASDGDKIKVVEERAFDPDEPDADNFGGPSDGDVDICPTCGGDGQTDMGTCQDCGGTGLPKGEGLTAIQTFNSASARLKGTTERRGFQVGGMELRDTSDGGLRFSGYASLTETPYSVGKFEETFAQGAFKRCLNDNPDVCLQVNHEGLPLARTSSGTMTLTEDARGLKVDATLDPSDPDVQSLVPKMRRGDLTEMSFAFRALEDEWSENDTKRLVRSATIHRGDVSVVTRGANSNTTASIRSVIEEMEQRGEEPQAIRESLERVKREAEELLEAEKPSVEEPQEVIVRSDLMWAQLEVARAKRARLGRGRRTA